MDTDWNHLTRELDRTKSGVFSGKNAAFLGSILCSMDFQWNNRIPTACTDGIQLMWNPEWFQSLLPRPRQTVLVHELWHPARLHMQRLGSRDPLIWNYASDIRINNDLIAEGYSFEGIENCWKDPQVAPGTAEEDIYDNLIKAGIKPPQMSPWALPGSGPAIPGDADDPMAGAGGDLMPVKPGDKESLARAVNNVVRAVQQAKMVGAGNVPGDVEQILSRFLKPIVPWEQLLHAFMKELSTDSYTWKRRNRRFNDVYLPSRFQDEGRLQHLMYYEDVSGSISDNDVVRFNSEVKYVKEFFNPPKLTLAQFDTQITQIIELSEGDPFERVKVIGRGGTCLIPVREHIIKHRPTAAIIFSDLECAPMEPLPFHIPIIWVCISNQRATVPFGKLIHIR